MKVKQIVDVINLSELSFGYAYDDYEKATHEGIDSDTDQIEITIYDDYQDGIYKDVHPYSEADNEKYVECCQINGSVSGGEKYQDQKNGFEINIFICSEVLKE